MSQTTINQVETLGAKDVSLIQTRQHPHRVLSIGTRVVTGTREPLEVICSTEERARHTFWKYKKDRFNAETVILIIDGRVKDAVGPLVDAKVQAHIEKHKARKAAQAA